MATVSRSPLIVKSQIQRRPYRLVRRRESMDATRRRIVEAAFGLHASVGPSRTTIAAIADRAGVQRHTVYAHFPDLDSLYEACTTHGMAATHMPESAPWQSIADPRERLRAGLGDLVGWYRVNANMLATILADVDPTAPTPTEPDPFESRMADLFGALAEGWTHRDPETRHAFEAVLHHAMAFETWRSLTTGGLSDAAIVELLVAVVGGVADGSIASGLRPQRA
ncbi:MAG: TetR/AcrR family transcriptional regulator [Chloroflexota bacterium]